ncbi:MAG: Uma2 family endonuclease [Trichlorobacter sp.]|jgi:Uma2 family endonuclease|nr:Uma2 family endonuclease [Trichlorobacter sp.]
MAQTAEKPHFTREDYLEWEALQLERHEYIGGETFALAGVRRVHAIIAGNIFATLYQQLKGKPCIPFIADMKLQIDAADAFYYPDIMVSCDERDKQADLFLEHPALIVEVLSESTAAYDMGMKFESYRLIPELKEYLLVDPQRLKIWLYRKNRSGEWVLHDFPEQKDVILESIACKLLQADIFEGVVND